MIEMSTIRYPMRFPEKDTQLFNDAQTLATKRRISLAELIRRCLIAEVDKAKESGELRKEEGARG